MTGLRKTTALLLLLSAAGSACAAALTAVDDGTKPADPLGVAQYQHYKPEPLPMEAVANLPVSKGPMSRPGAAAPFGQDVLPPLSLPSNPAQLPGSPAQLPPLPGGAGQTSPSAIPGLAPGQGFPAVGQPVAEEKPIRPKLQATFAGRSPSASVDGRTVLIGQKLPKSELSLKAIKRGSAVLSDGTEVWLGDEIPVKAETKSKAADGKGV